MNLESAVETTSSASENIFLKSAMDVQYQLYDVTTDFSDVVVYCLANFILLTASSMASLTLVRLLPSIPVKVITVT